MMTTSQFSGQAMPSLPTMLSSFSYITQSIRSIAVLPDFYSRSKQQLPTHVARKPASSRLMKQCTEELKSILEESGISQYLRLVFFCHPVPAPIAESSSVEQNHNWVSAQSFFENKNGFKESDLLHLQTQSLVGDPTVQVDIRRMGLVTNRLLSPNYHSLSPTQYRGFKTLRSGNTGFGSMLFPEAEKETVDSDKKLRKSKKKETSKEKEKNIDNPDRIAIAIEDLQKVIKEKDKVKRVDIGKKLLEITVLAFLCVVLYKMFQGTFGTLQKAMGKYQPVKAEESNIRFYDVRGCDEVKEQLKDITYFLTNKGDYEEIGARLPKGVLLSGPPGCGKTLMAKAMAGEAGVPFFQVSGSEFDEMFVGLGAKRVRELFEAAAQYNACVIFIDEIDSVGRRRTSSPYQPYANQTINQLLSEMDGFSPSSGTLVVGATNKPEDLDEALTRPGRFDMMVHVGLPDKRGRKDILNLYLDKVKSSENIDVDRVAGQTIGMSGADLQNLVNQAAMHAVKVKQKLVTEAHLLLAKDLIAMGPERKNMEISEKTNRNTAYHEAGHALVAYHTKHAHKVSKITIMPRGRALGVTSFNLDEDDEFGTTKGQLRARMDTAMGGFVAEELIFGDDEVTTGASDDFKQATAIARNMVTKFGMSDVGFMTTHSEDISPDMHSKMDAEVDRLLKESCQRAKDILKQNSDQHHLLAEALLQFETISQHEMDLLLQTKKLSAISNDREEQNKKERASEKQERGKPPTDPLGFLAPGLKKT